MQRLLRCQNEKNLNHLKDAGRKVDKSKRYLGEKIIGNWEVGVEHKENVKYKS